GTSRGRSSPGGTLWRMAREAYAKMLGPNAVLKRAPGAPFVRPRPPVILCVLSLASWCGALARPTTQTVTYPIGDEKVQAYMSLSSSTTLVPGIVLLHEMWGLNEQIMGVADRLSELGYVVLAPDMYKGKLGADPGLAQDLAHALKDDRGVAIVKGAVDYLHRLDNAATRPIAIVGFGVGARIGLLAALRGVEVKSTVMFYGSFPTSREELKTLGGSLMGIFAAKDISLPVEQVKA